MTAVVILWSHALAALLFGALALVARRPPLARWPLAGALALSGVAAVVAAGLGMHDPGAILAEALRDAGWIGALLLLLRRHGGGHAAVVAVGVSAAGATVAALLVRLVDPGDAAAALFATGQMLRMMALAGALLLLCHAAAVVRRAGDARAAGGAVALAMLWGGELVLAAAAWALGEWPPMLVAARGAVLLVAALLFGATLTQRRATILSPSRQFVWPLVAGAALAGYGGLVAVASDYAARLGEHGRIAQVAVAVGAGAALMVLVATPWLKAWARVMLAKHLFGHRFDYRVEWQRFTVALGGSEPLAERIVRALAGLTDSPAGLLLGADDARLTVEADWRWVGKAGLDASSLAPRLATGWIVDLDRERDGSGFSAEPDAWAVVPLIHGEALVAAVVLARPVVTRALDWEDFDLLRVAGRQAASHLAEERARAALAEAKRFDEFNRRFAFILHDLKNLASQITLTASNARRHADKPAFRADMVATLGECAERMTTLLGRLERPGDAPAGAATACDLTVLATRVAARFASHPVVVEADGEACAMAHPARLEQAIDHLVRNAVEASTAGQPVSVRVGRAGDEVTLAVIDRGDGMAPGFVRDELFRPFASTKPAGFGLGACEARQLVRSMGGMLTVDSREGEGTCFAIRLPTAPTMEKAA